MRAGDNRARALLRFIERAVYMPFLARLPAVLGYRLAWRRGDWQFRSQAAKRTEVADNLQLVLGNELSPAAAQQVTREWFRLASCELVDMKRLRHTGRPLVRLVEIRGREHLEAALAAGKGAILCHGHFGSYNSSFSVLHASGFPVTTIGRLWYKYEAGMSPTDRWLWDFYFRPVQRHRQRPNIEPFPGRPESAALAVAALRANELVTIAIDPPPLDEDRARAIEVPFLGRPARLLPGIVTLARVTGAPVLMIPMYRRADYRHQVLEISGPIPVEGDTATAFERCAAEVSAAIRRSPAHWETWSHTDKLVDLGLIPSQRDQVTSREAGSSTTRLFSAVPRQPSGTSHDYLFPARAGLAGHWTKVRCAWGTRARTLGALPRRRIVAGGTGGSSLGLHQKQVTSVAAGREGDRGQSDRCDGGDTASRPAGSARPGGGGDPGGLRRGHEQRRLRQGRGGGGL